MNKLLKLLSTCEPLFVGVSLSLCIQQIIEGKRKLTDILGIISNTQFADDDEFVKICKGYGESYWAKDPQLAYAVAHFLRDSDCIFQPRLEEGAEDMWSHDLHPDDGGYWLQINPSCKRWDAEENDNPILDELINGDKIDAIREMKKATGLDLMHCKKAVEAMLAYRELLPSGDES